MSNTAIQQSQPARSGEALLEAVGLDNYLAEMQQRYGISDAGIGELRTIFHEQMTGINLQSVPVGIFAFFEALLGVISGQFENIETAFQHVTTRTGASFDFNMLSDNLSRIYMRILNAENPDIRQYATVITGVSSNGALNEQAVAGLDNRYIQEHSLGARMFHQLGVDNVTDIDTPGITPPGSTSPNRPVALG